MEHDNDQQRLYADFGLAVARLLDQRGWFSLSKKELSQELLYAAHQAGLLSLDEERFSLAERLRASLAASQAVLGELGTEVLSEVVVCRWSTPNCCPCNT